MITIPMAMTPKKISKLLACLMAQRAVGNLAAIDVKMRSDMPLPMPRSVMSSPIHMMRPVPAVMVMTMSRIAYQALFEISEEQAETLDEPNRAPERATVIRVVDCRMPSAMVR